MAFAMRSRRISRETERVRSTWSKSHRIAAIREWGPSEDGHVRSRHFQTLQRERLSMWTVGTVPLQREGGFGGLSSEKPCGDATCRFHEALDPPGKGRVGW